MTDPYLKKTGKLFVVIHPRTHKSFKFNNRHEAELLLELLTELEAKK